MAEQLELEIVTPERLVVQDRADEVQIPGKNGYIGVLPGHAPLITELAVGEITYRKNGDTERLSVAWGFAEVLPEKVTILAETAECAGEIDVARAEEALRKAESELASGNPETDYPRVLNALRRAETRLQVAKDKDK
jgi:F-type H+-transporting ATPase subunit epsilon